jgi:hypothetical protein
MELVQIARDKVMLYVDDLDEKRKLVKSLQEHIRAAGSRMFFFFFCVLLFLVPHVHRCICVTILRAHLS